MATDPNLDAAYALRSAEEVKALYRAWAESYDSGFAAAQGYRLPELVAAAFVAADPGGRAPVLDIGAGTGLVGAALDAAGIGPLEAVDLSDEMLTRAQAKGLYARLFAGDVTARLPVESGRYRGVVSAGTFTLGHVGPDGLDEVLRVAAPGARVVLSINAQHWAAAGFAAAFEARGAMIAELSLPRFRIYDDRADPGHRDDLGLIASFCRV